MSKKMLILGLKQKVFCLRLKKRGIIDSTRGNMLYYLLVNHFGEFPKEYVLLVQRCSTMKQYQSKL